MTASVPAATSYSYTGNGVTKAFSFPTKFLESADLRVALWEDDEVTGEPVETVQVLGTHYSVTGAGNPSGGTVTFGVGVAALTAAQTVKIDRRTAPKQTIDLEDLGKTPGDTLETQLDRFAMALQDLEQRFTDVETTPGPTGQAGVSAIWFGTGAPSSALGSDGDLYENKSNGDLYSKSSGSWTLQDNLTGPTGATGAQGIQGVPGAAGAGTGDMLAANNGSDFADISTAFDTIKQAATDAYAGVVELASDAEGETGTDDERAMTPASTKAALDLGYRSNGVLTVLTAASGNYTPSALNVRAIRLRMKGPGGAGGGADCNDPDSSSGAGGGGEGEEIEAIIPIADASLAIAYVNAAPGVGGDVNGSDGTDGGTSTWASTVATAVGGKGGKGMKTPYFRGAAGGEGGTGGTVPTNGVAKQGCPGQNGAARYGGGASADAAEGGAGGGNGGGKGVSCFGSSTAGNDATGHGSGGSGACCAGTTTGQTGGNGKRGRIIVEELI